MDRYQIKNLLINEFNRLPVHHLTANKKEISIRCPYCGDSKKSSKSSHLYVNIQPNEDEPFTFYCQKCKAKGIVNSSFLKNLRINQNTELIIDLEKDLTSVNKNSKKKIFKSSLYKRKLQIPVSEDNKLNRIKLEYINKRLGTNLTFSDLKDYKIILNLFDLLDYNKIKHITCNDIFAETLDSNFIGFISYDNNYVVMRNLSKKEMPEMRYHNYNIFNNYDNTKKFYIIPQKFDTMSDKVDIVITEGVFDILSVYFNYETNHSKNKLFVSVNGIGYDNLIHELIRMGILNINLLIYGDNDQDVKLYKDLKKNFYPFINKVTLYNNTVYKDFGDVTKGVSIRKTIIG